MEEYRDLSLTVRAFQRALGNPDLKDLKAGIVLQAYLPDAHLWQKELTQWAKDRVASGGAPIKVRLVKGANMEMEKTEASLKHWPLAPYSRKIDTDSNYKIMAEYALRPENIAAVHLGVGSHNLFELAYCYELACQNQVTENFSLEMLEGMSESARKAICRTSQKTPISYAPVAQREQFTNAIAYLVRRLDENTHDDNFMRYSFSLKTNSVDWVRLKQQFLDSFTNKEKVFIGSHRQQNRLTEKWDDYKGGAWYTGSFQNEPDTDWSLSANQRWVEDIRKKWMKTKDEEIPVLPVVVGGQEIAEDREVVDCIDKSQIQDAVVCGRYRRARGEDLVEAVKVARRDEDGWREKSPSERQRILGQVANRVRAKRGDLIGVAAAEVGKVFTETDVEVSEAVDFLEFYGHSLRFWEQMENVQWRGKGVGLVVPPWNFPVAIPLGGVAAALAAGNTVILKPASQAVLCSYEMCKCFWEAGVSKKTLQFVPCPGSLAQEYLVQNEGVDFVILTGSEKTAQSMLSGRSNLFLTAETGGKNATIVTSMADREQAAIKNVVASAFLNSGQKCSATSLLILEREVYEDPHFKEALVDAAQSLPVGSVWNLESRLGTLAGPVGGDLKKAMELLEEGESWALKPEFVDQNPYMLSPGIKWGVAPGSFSHLTELFGPILSVLPVDSFHQAIEVVNQTGYGLTSGIESLDEREIAEWREKIKAGNLYINRGTTGAIVLRQPFGGVGKSAIGAGRKVGIYNYITQFMNAKEVSPPAPLQEGSPSSSPESNLEKGLDKWKSGPFQEEVARLQTALKSYLYHYQKEFSQQRDECQIRGEENSFGYKKVQAVAIRVSKGDSLFECLSRVLAARVLGIRIHLSLDELLDSALSDFLQGEVREILGEGDTVTSESEAQWVQVFSSVDRIIYSRESQVSDFVFEEAARLVKFIVRTPPMMEGRLELLHYLDEQSVSYSYHRYGNLGGTKRKRLVSLKLQ